MSRGAEPSGGEAARRLRRAECGYMEPFARVEHGLSLRQRMLPLRARPSTLSCNRTSGRCAWRLRI